MADNDTTPQTPVIDLEHLRPLLREVVAAEISSGLLSIIQRLERLEQDSSASTRRLDETRAEMKALDAAYRDTRNASAEMVTAANSVVGKFEAMQKMLDTWIATAEANSREVTILKEGLADIRRDIYGDTARPHNRSVLGELDKMPALIAGAIKTEVHPLVTRMDAIHEKVERHDRFILAREAWESRAKSVVKVMFSRKALAGLVTAILTYVGYSGATQTNILYQVVEIIRTSGGGG